MTTDINMEKTGDSSVRTRCQEIRRTWTASERKLRELRACVAQSRLAVAILFQELGCVQPGR